jgi:hypothetical protein
MNRFHNESNVRRIELGDGDWVEVPEIISMNVAEKIEAGGKDAICAVIVRWNLKDGENVAEISPESVARLDIRVANQIANEVKDMLTVPKA